MATKTLTVAELLREALLNQTEISRSQPVVSYVRARHAIDQTMHNREERRNAKMAVIEFLGGRKKPPIIKHGVVVRPSFVLFKLPDGNERKAQF